MRKRIRILFAALLGVAFVAGTGQPAFVGQAETKGETQTAGKVKTAGEKSLYERLGGKKAISAVVDEFVANCATDARINKFFATNAADPNHLASFKGKLVDQICQAGGGPCTYMGKSMKEAHAGMGISTEDFNALAEDLLKALDKLKVSEKEKNELLGILGPMKIDIVEKP